MADYGEVYKASDGWRWRIKGGNHEPVASGEAHTTKWGAKRAIRRLNPNIAIHTVRS